MEFHKSSNGDSEESEDDEVLLIQEHIRQRNAVRFKSCSKSAVAFLFSHVGLAAMVVGYSIMGGLLFQALEAPTELQGKHSLKWSMDNHVGDVMSLALNLNIQRLNDQQFVNEIREILNKFQKEVVSAVKESGFNGKMDSDEASVQWSFAGSLLYAVTVITTIGYGHVVPKTTAGRLVTILYALVGIPLTFLYLSNMGNFAAKCFRLFYKKVCCGLCIYVRLMRHKSRMESVREHAEAQMKSQEAFDSVVDSTFHARASLLSRRATTFGVYHPLGNSTPSATKRGVVVDATGCSRDVDSLPNSFRNKFRNSFRLSKRKSNGHRRVNVGANDQSSSSLHSIKQENQLDVHNYRQKESYPVLGNVSTGNLRCSQRKKLIYPTPVESKDDIRLVIDPDDNILIENRQNTKLEKRNHCETSNLSASLLEQKNPRATLQRYEISNNSFSPTKETLASGERVPVLRQSQVKKFQNPTTPSEKKTQVSEETNSIPPVYKKRRKPSLEEIELKETPTDVRLASFVSTQQRDQSVGVSDASFAELEHILQNSLIRTDHSATSKIHPARFQMLRNFCRSSVTTRTQRVKLFDTDDIDNTDCFLTTEPGHKNSIQSIGITALRPGNDIKPPLLPSAPSLTTTRIAASATATAAVIAAMASQFANSPSCKNVSKPASFESPMIQLGVKSNHISTQPQTSHRTNPESSVSSHVHATLIGTPSSKSKSSKNLSSLYKRLQTPFLNRTRSSMKWSDRSNTVKRGSFKKTQDFQTTSSNLLRRLARPSKSLDDLYGLGQSSPRPYRKSAIQRQTGSPIVGTVSSPVATTRCFKEQTPRRAVHQPRKSVTTSYHKFFHFDPPTRLSKTPSVVKRNFFMKDKNVFGVPDIGDDMDSVKMTVPISICLIIIALYIYLGALLFSLWEDWDMLTGSYFCFITLSTIGFGDIVPGTDVSQKGAHEKLLLCSIWLVVGLSLLAMCFNLMQEEVKEKFRWIGIKIGILKV